MKINKWKLIWRLLTNKKFTIWFGLVVEYALNNYEEKRGDGASDVLIYDSYYGKDIFTK